MAYRVLDVTPGQGGDPDARRHLGGGPQQIGSPARGGSGEHDDRLMPQVDGVRADPYPAQRFPSQQPAHARRRVSCHRHHRHRGQRQQNDPVGIEELRVGALAPYENPDHDQTDGSDRVEDAAGPGRDLRGQRPARPHHRQGRAEQHPERPGVGALVDSGRVEARVIEQRHLDGRGGRQHQRHPSQARPHADPECALGQKLESEQQQPRPQQVELLLNGQRPQVTQR